MLSIDGLITGLDTTSLIDGLLQIQQAQIDRQNARRAEILGKQTAFSGIEARLLALQGTLGRLASVANSSIRSKVVSSTDEDLITAAASASAINGVYRLRVDRLASAHTLSSQGMASTESAITTGTLGIRVGAGNETTITIDETNNSVQGLVDAINSSEAGVTASLINDGTNFRVLLTSNETGKNGEIFINNNLLAAEDGGIRPTFVDEVEAAENALVKLGSGPGAISVESSSNRLDDLIDGVTIDLNGADVTQEITLTVSQDLETSRDAVVDFVDAYNDVMKFINDQSQFNAETLQAGQLLGDRSATSIQNDIQLEVLGVIGGLNSEMNRLTALGVSVSDSGTLNVDSGRLEDVLSGRVDGVSSEDVAKLFALSGTSDNQGIRFVVGNSNTQEATVQVDITSVAQRGSVVSTGMAATTVIDETNNQLQVEVNGQASSTLTLTAGTYTREELAAHVQDLINSDTELQGRRVFASVEGDALRVTSQSYGSDSRITILGGAALAALGFSGGETDRGQDVVGSFIVNGVEETATGRGNLLIGDQDNEQTADLQVRVSLSASQLADGPEATLEVRRGVAARLDEALHEMLDPDPLTGRMKIVNQRFDDTLESIQQNIDRLNARFEAEQQSLLEQFTALEQAVSQLQTTSSFLSSQLATIPKIGV